jgi:hypothetical protein
LVIVETLVSRIGFAIERAGKPRAAGVGAGH